MKVLLTPIGSAGDNYPFAGLGMELARRGHEVAAITSGHFESLMRKAGLEYVEAGTEEEYQQTLRDPDLWHPRKGFDTVARLISVHLKRLFQAVSERCEPGRTLVVGHSLDLASRVLQEKTGMPMVSVHLSPSLFRSEHQIPVMTGSMDLSFLPRWLKRAMWTAIDRWIVDPGLARVVNELRASVGLPPVRRIFHEWLHSPLLTIGMFPDWFAPPQPDWPAQVRLAGFPLFDALEAKTPPEVEAFLADGERPIVFTPGSANPHGHEFLQAAVEACQTLGQRGLLLTPYDGHVPAGMPPRVRRFAFAPLSQILPRCAALVHHGGIGTTAAALAAGLPQVIMPLSHDQPDNAARVRRLGVGERIMPAKFRGRRLGDTLKRLLDSEQVQRSCAESAQRCAEMNAIERACDMIEESAERALRHGEGAALSPASA